MSVFVRYYVTLYLTFQKLIKTNIKILRLKSFSLKSPPAENEDSCDYWKNNGSALFNWEDYPSGKKEEEDTSVILKSSIIIIIIKLTPSFVRMFYFATRVYNLLSAYDIVQIGKCAN